MIRKLFLFLILSAECLWAAPEFDPCWQDGMVLQRGQPIEVRGRAEAGEELELSLGGKSVRFKADAAGRWTASLPAFAAEGQGRDLRLRGGSGEAVLKEVLIGDVWLCSGQSNMLFTIGQCSEGKAALAAADAKAPLRLMNFKMKWQTGPGAWKSGQLPVAATWFEPEWSRPDAAHLKDFSAVAWFFGQGLIAAEPGVPLGLINCSVGGSALISWLPEDWLKRDALGASELEHWLDGSGGEASWCEVRAGQNLRALKKPGEAFHPYKPGALDAAGYARMEGFRLAGILWYQGESDAEQSWSVPAYQRLLPELAASLRRRFGEQAAFVCIQLPGMERRLWPEMRAAQAAALKSVPRSALVSTWDTGERRDVHPKAKQEVGRRAAIAAIALAKKAEPAAPELRSERFEGGDLLLAFSSPVTGPASPAGFEIRDRSGTWKTAAASLENGGIRLKAAAAGLAWRYAWKPFPGIEALKGASGLPVVPCRRGGEVRRLACIGDSITYGMGIENRDADNYPAQLQRLLGDDWLLGNFGNSGRCIILSSKRGSESRAWMKQKEFQRALAFAPDSVVCNLGINDVMAFQAAAFEKDYSALIDAFRRQGKPEIRIWAPLPPLFKGQKYFGSPALAGIEASLQKLARACKVKTIDMKSPFVERGDLFPDHIHPNGEGASIIAREVAKSLQDDGRGH
ncbi:MAG: hypothetical protein RL095_813 [Verrucomicrobiota bacterium]|jgi:sialate O-acetylesterase